MGIWEVATFPNLGAAIGVGLAAGGEFSKVICPNAQIVQTFAQILLTLNKFLYLH
jgi:hypothetical protein